ncbi:MAG: alpha/beta hydrolase, partial [Alteraurantiacibacter sp.]
YWTHADDEIQLRVGLWRPTKSSNGTIFVFPGRTEYIEKYGPTIAGLAEHGYTSFVIDWRGHGLSDRVSRDPKVSHVDHFSDYQRDVAAMVSKADALALPKPWYLLGHSMGALIGLRALIEGLPVNAWTFTAPLWGIPLSPIERYAAWPLTWLAQAAGRGQAYAPGNKAQEGQCYVLSVEFEGNRLTNDPAKFQYMVDQAKALPTMQIAAPSMGWVFQALNECRRLSAIDAPDIPGFVFCGDQDVVVDLAAIEDRMGRWRKGQFERIANARHDLLSEVPEVRDRIMEKVYLTFEAADTLVRGSDNRISKVDDRLP